MSEFDSSQPLRAPELEKFVTSYAYDHGHSAGMEEVANIASGLRYDLRTADERLAVQAHELAAAHTREQALRAERAQAPLCLRVTADGEYGTFYLRHGHRPSELSPDGYWCELVCHTSFGTFGHYWGSMGVPVAQFLSALSYDYAMGKFMGHGTDVFDGQTALAAMRKRVDEALDAEEIEGTDHIDAMATLDEACPNDECEWYALVMGNATLSTLVHEGGGVVSTVPNPQALGFWAKLWPEFLTGLAALHAEEPVA